MDCGVVGRPSTDELASPLPNPILEDFIHISGLDIYTLFMAKVDFIYHCIIYGIVTYKRYVALFYMHIVEWNRKE